ncbi:hypothetical protein AVEN_230673-1 [Araneus ventricosus]|uniref:Uncharacterized protein n=1 Tax=Araneus ventricosus TaxID=182803 RepID=A0A4Y2A2S7_ARAVE|nr:hypothetical protein AVEN_230673-1 [Araneus ventricosus]
METSLLTASPAITSTDAYPKGREEGSRGREKGRPTEPSGEGETNVAWILLARNERNGSLSRAPSKPHLRLPGRRVEKCQISVKTRASSYVW